MKPQSLRVKFAHFRFLKDGKLPHVSILSLLNATLQDDLDPVIKKLSIFLDTIPWIFPDLYLFHLLKRPHIKVVSQPDLARLYFETLDWGTTS